MTRALSQHQAGLTPEGILRTQLPGGSLTPACSTDRRVRLGIVLSLLLVAVGTVGSVAGCLDLVGVLPESCPFRIKHPGWPFLIVLVGWAGVLIFWPRPRWMWVRTFQSRAARVGSLWRSQGLLGRCVMVAIFLHAAISLGYLLNAPEALIRKYQEDRMLAETSGRIFGGTVVANLDFFLERCRREIPGRANVVYRGHWEAMLAAYRLYPRRLYLLPEDAYRLAGAWNRHRWLEILTKGASRAEDRTDQYWLSRQVPPESSAADRARFFAERGITYVIEFDEDRPGLCRIKKVPPTPSLMRDGKP